MQYSHPNSDQAHRGSIPPGSPWRGSHVPMSGQIRGPGSQPQFGQSSAMKLPSLPRLGTSGQNTQSQTQRPANQPSFAQMIQTQKPASLVQAGADAQGSNQFGAHSQKPGVPAGSVGYDHGKDNTKETGAQILGTVNAHTMPRVNTSYGMSSLNTVLPGMSTDRTHAGKAAPPATGGVGAKQSLGESSASTALMGNLTLQDRRGSASTSVSELNGQRQGDTERYGLRSLLDAMETRDKEHCNVILGSNVSHSGLNMTGAGGRISHTFASPWQETSNHPVIPDYTLPSCYNIDTVIPQQQKFLNFDEGALFYIFYTMPRDAMQEAAATELTNRSWRYHKELKMWLTKDPMSEPIQTNNQEESGIYIFFDPATWKKIKREYILYYPDIA